MRRGYPQEALGRWQIVRLGVSALVLSGISIGFYQWYAQRQQQRVETWPLEVLAIVDAGDFRPVQVVKPFPPITEFDVVGVPVFHGFADLLSGGVDPLSDYQHRNLL